MKIEIYIKIAKSYKKGQTRYLHSCSNTKIELYSSDTQLDVLYDMSKLIHRKRNFMWICNTLN